MKEQKNKEKSKNMAYGFAGAIFILLLSGLVSGAFVTGETTINVPAGKTAIYYVLDNADAGEGRDAFCQNYDYQVNVTDENGEEVSNPESCASFADRQIKGFWTDNVIKYRTDNARAAIDIGTVNTPTD